MIRRLLIGTFFCLVCSLAFPQSVRVEILSGANVSTAFNSIAKYKTGISLPNYTTIGISVDEGPDDYLQWEITINGEDLGADGFNGTNPLNTIPLDVVEISTNIVSGCGECQEFYNPGLWKLTNIPQVIIDGNQSLGADDISPALLYPYNFAADQFAISYFIGVPPNTSMFGFPSDFYSEVVVLTLTMAE